MKRVHILVCKIALFILKKMGRGSAFPGDMLLKLNQQAFAYFTLPEKTIFVTGTTGKTTICGTLTEIYKKNGYKVATNAKGSNLSGGVLSCLLASSTLSGKVKADVLIVEIDERYVKQVFTYIHPTYFIINNLSRDQLARNGHFDIVFQEIKEHIFDDMHLILNADDPLVSKFALGHKGEITYYGLKKTKYSKKKNDLNTLDLLYCPLCQTKLKFDFFHYGNLGSYHCPKCSFQREQPKFEATLKTDTSFTIHKQEIQMDNNALYTIYNLLACYSVATVSGIEESQISDVLNHLSLKIKRLDTFMLHNHTGILLLSKNETPISYNQSLEYIEKQPENKTVVIGFDHVSGRYQLKDLSWLYDVNFELLNNPTISKIICVGIFANDLSVRLKYAGIEEKKVITCLDSNDMVETIDKKATGKIYCMLYFDLDKYFRKQLKEVK